MSRHKMGDHAARLAPLTTPRVALDAQQKEIPKQSPNSEVNILPYLATAYITKSIIEIMARPDFDLTICIIHFYFCLQRLDEVWC